MKNAQNDPAVLGPVERPVRRLADVLEAMIAEAPDLAAVIGGIRQSVKYARFRSVRLVKDKGNLVCMNQGLSSYAEKWGTLVYSFCGFLVIPSVTQKKKLGRVR